MLNNRSFKDLMATPPWQWSAQLPDLQAFAPWAKRHLPFVVHTPLLLPTECWNYIEQFDYQRDFSGLPQTRMRADTREIIRHIDGWQEDPVRCRSEFAEACERFFPQEAERPVLINALSDVVSTFAAVTKARRIGAELKAFASGYREPPSYHRDWGYEMTAGIYLKGNTTAFRRPDWGRGLTIHQAPNGMIYRSVPERSIALWPFNQEHASPHTDQTRVGLFLLVHRP